MLEFSIPIARRLNASGHRIIVTGAGGWLGRATLAMLDSALNDTFDERVVAFGSHVRQAALPSGRSVEVAALKDLPHYRPRPSFVMHYAYLGKEKVAELGEDRFSATNDEISDLVAEYCTSVPEGGMFFPSSGAARYAGEPDGIDPSRKPYGASKVGDELRFLGLRRERFCVAVCRIFNMAGPFINKIDSYALSSILLDIERGGPIVLNAARPVFRSYMHVRDIVDLAFTLLLDGNPPDLPFDTAGEEVIEVGELAARAAVVTGNERMTILRPLLRAAGEDRYLGDGTTIRGLLRASAIQPIILDEQLKDTARYLFSLWD